METMTLREFTGQLRLLYREGKQSEALGLLERHLAAFPKETARFTLWKMCLLSLCGRPDDVLSIFRQGLEQGLWWRERQFQDSDLDAVRELPEFKQLVALSQERFEAARAHIQGSYVLLVPEPPADRYPLVIALHGHDANERTILEHWEPVRRKGWLVLSAQSTQAIYSDYYCWDDPAQGLADLRSYHEQVSQSYPIDPQRLVIAGFSQGGGMSIYAALKGDLPVQGFIGIATWWADPGELAGERQGVRGYFVVGAKDHTLARAREIQDTLRRNKVPFDEEVHADLGHEFPADFGRSFQKAIDFIFMEKE